jgi:hypothetical protein
MSLGRKLGGLLGNLLLAAFGVGLAFLASEWVLHALAPNESRNSGRLHVQEWNRDYARPRMLPNARAIHRGVEVTTNSLGLRDVEVPVAKPPGTYRILMIGDSFVYGQGIARLEETLPKQLQSRLRSAGHPGAEVVNFGVCGLNTFEEYMTYEQQGRRLDPDMVVLVWIPFDHLLNGYRAADLAYFLEHRTIPREDRPAHTSQIGDDERPRRAGLVGWLAESYTATYFGRRLKGLLVRFGFNLNRYEDQQHQRMDSEGYRLMYESLESLARSCERDSVAFQVVIFPGLQALDSDYYQNLIYGRLESFCREHDIPCMSLFPAFKGSDPGKLHVSIMDAHPNARANAIAADALAAHVLRRLPEASRAAGGP